MDLRQDIHGLIKKIFSRYDAPSNANVITEDNEDRQNTRKSSCMQMLMTVLANTALISSGMTLGFTAVALPYMEKPNDLLHIDKGQSSWIASCASFIIPVGCLLSGPIMDRWGRRSALLVSCVPAAAGWAIMGSFPTLAGIYTGRVLTGLATGLSSTPATVFIAESSTAALRGFLVNGTSIAIAIGISLVYILGLFLKSDWQLLSVLCSIFPVVSFLLIGIWMPESSVWLIGRGRKEDATNSLVRVRAIDSKSAANEVEQLAASRFKAAQGQSMRRDEKWATLKAFAFPEAYKPFIIMNVFFLFQQLTGIFVIIFYAVDVVKEAGVSMDPYIVTVLIGLTRLLFTVIGGWMSRQWGRRVCSLISGVGMTASLILLGGYLFIEENYTDEPVNLALDLPKEFFEKFNTSLNLTDIEVRNSSNPYLGANNSSDLDLASTESNTSIIPVVSILVYILASTIGFLTLPWAMLGEVFPTKVRGVASGLTTCITYVVSAIMVKLYPTMLESLGEDGVFLFYGGMALIGTVFVAIFLPETQGKTLAQVEQSFAGSTRRRADEEEALTMKKMLTIKPAAETRKGTRNI